MRRQRGPKDHVIVLDDGRALGYADLGDPDGFPVVYCHGGLSSRIDAGSAEAPAAAAGLRLLAVDRPGIGLSDRHAGSGLADWADDVAALVDLLGIEDFAAMGWSGGGSHAAALGHYLSGRVSDVVLIASVIPPDWPGMMDQINTMDRVFLRLSGRGALVDRAAFAALGALATSAPAFLLAVTTRGLTPQSRAALDRDPEEFARATAEGMVNTGGVLDDYRLWHRPWGFDLRDLQVPVHLWHGREDEFCPPDWSRRMAAAIPGAVLTMVPDAGHFVARDHWVEILTAIRR